MQEQYDQSFLKSARKRLHDANAVKDMAQIQKYSNILLKHDSYNEKLYQEIMEIYASGGNYNMAIKLYYDLEKVLDEELGVEPFGEITELFHRIFNVKRNVTREIGAELAFHRKNRRNLSYQRMYCRYGKMGKSSVCCYKRRRGRG